MFRSERQQFDACFVIESEMSPTFKDILCRSTEMGFSNWVPVARCQRQLVSAGNPDSVAPMTLMPAPFYERLVSQCRIAIPLYCAREICYYGASWHRTSIRQDLT